MRKDDGVRRGGSLGSLLLTSDRKYSCGASVVCMRRLQCLCPGAGMHALNIECFSFLPSIPLYRLEIDSARGGSRHPARAISLVITAEAAFKNGPRQARGRIEKELQPTCMSVRYMIISHDYQVVGWLLGYLLINLPEVGEQ